VCCIRVLWPLSSKSDGSQGCGAGSSAPAFSPCPGDSLSLPLPPRPNASSPPSRRSSARIQNMRGKAAGISRPCPFPRRTSPAPGGAPGGTRTRGPDVRRGGAEPRRNSNPRGREAAGGAPEAEGRGGAGRSRRGGPGAMEARDLRWEALAALRTSSKGQLSYCRRWLRDEVRARCRRAPGRPRRLPRCLRGGCASREGGIRASALGALPQPPTSTACLVSRQGVKF